MRTIKFVVTKKPKKIRKKKDAIKDVRQHETTTPEFAGITDISRQKIANANQFGHNTHVGEPLSHQEEWPKVPTLEPQHVPAYFAVSRNYPPQYIPPPLIVPYRKVPVDDMEIGETDQRAAQSLLELQQMGSPGPNMIPPHNSVSSPVTSCQTPQYHVPSFNISPRNYNMLVDHLYSQAQNRQIPFDFIEKCIEKAWFDTLNCYRQTVIEKDVITTMVMQDLCIKFSIPSLNHHQNSLQRQNDSITQGLDLSIINPLATDVHPRERFQHNDHGYEAFSNSACPVQSQHEYQNTHKSSPESLSGTPYPEQHQQEQTLNFDTANTPSQKHSNLRILAPAPGKELPTPSPSPLFESSPSAQHLPIPELSVLPEPPAQSPINLPPLLTLIHHKAFLAGRIMMSFEVVVEWHQRVVDDESVRRGEIERDKAWDELRLCELLWKHYFMDEEWPFGYVPRQSR